MGIVVTLKVSMRSSNSYLWRLDSSGRIRWSVLDSGREAKIQINTGSNHFNKTNGISDYYLRSNQLNYPLIPTYIKEFVTREDNKSPCNMLSIPRKLYWVLFGTFKQVFKVSNDHNNF